MTKSNKNKANVFPLWIWAVLGCGDVAAVDLAAESATVEVKASSDRVKGAMLLSLYADALGASTEFGDPTDPLVISLPELDSFVSSQSQSPWYIWDSYEAILESTGSEKTRGVVTDDSYFKLEVFAPYRDWLIAKGRDKGDPEKPSDQLFLEFILGLDQQISIDGQRSDHQFANSYEASHVQLKQHVTDWAWMARDAFSEKAAGNEAFTMLLQTQPEWSQEQNFFRRNDPVCFGLFMFLPFVQYDSLLTPEEVFHKYARMTALDQGYAGLVTGIFALALHDLLFGRQVFGKQVFDRDTSESVSKGNGFEHLEAGIEKAAEKAARSSGESLLGAIEHPAVQKAAKDLGADTLLADIALLAARVSVKIADRLDSSEPQIETKTQRLQAARRILFEARRAELPGSVTGLRFDPMEFLFVTLVALRFGQKDRALSLQLIANAGGDTDTIGAIAAQLIGAELGYQKAKKLFPELKDVMTTLVQLGYDPSRLYKPVSKD